MTEPQRGHSDSSAWLRPLKDRRGRPSSDAFSPLVSVARVWVSLALLPVATWNVSHPSLRVFSVDSRVSFVSSKLYLEPPGPTRLLQADEMRLDGSKICVCKIPGFLNEAVDIHRFLSHLASSHQLEEASRPGGSNKFRRDERHARNQH